MATWGKKTVHYDKYYPNSSLYYQYSTTSDQYRLNLETEKDYGMGPERYEDSYTFGPEEGEVIMEALINHILAFDFSGDEVAFMNRYLKNNRFRE